MPMTWTPEANAKLFLAVLDQIKDQGVKINNAKLAEYMGPECSVRAVDQQVQKLKKQAGPSDTPSTGGTAGAGDGTASGSASATPTKTPTKRRAAGSKAATPRKRGKKQAAAIEDNGIAANGDGDDGGAGFGRENADGQGGSQAVDGDAAGHAGKGDEEV